MVFIDLCEFLIDPQMKEPCVSMVYYYYYYYMKKGDQETQHD